MMMNKLKPENLEAVDLGSSEEESEESSSSESESEDEEEKGKADTPPAYGYPDDGEWPPFVLISELVYIADRRNATTATVTAAVGSNLKGSIQVTFCPVAPPLLSYLTFHAPDMDQAMLSLRPQILTTETNGGLLLLLVTVCRHPYQSVLSGNREYFVYDPRAAKLDHLPHPGRQHEFRLFTLAIVRKCNQHCRRRTTTTATLLRPFHLVPHGHGQGAACQDHHHDDDCTYVVAAQAVGFGDPQTSHLCMYHSDTRTWSSKPVVLFNSYPKKIFTSKTLTIGGDKGTVAWVDLWQCIIFCDVLDEKPELRLLTLPEPIMPKKAVGHGNPRSVRNVALVGNFIKFADMHVHFDRSSRTARRWKAATWSIRTGSLSPEDWTMDHRVYSALIPPQPSLLDMLKAGAAAIKKKKKKKKKKKAADPTLSTLYVGLPNFSLQDDDATVYFLAKIDYRDSRHTAWVLAIDMKNMTVKEVHPINAKGTLGLAHGYFASRISAYLKPALANTEKTRDAVAEIP
uniref:Uncharacterized protein n=1 Tax=Avena sativa TaxID=4498 RepID=A0ACD5U1P6_AVESA